MQVKVIIFISLAVLALGSYKSGGSIYVGTFATCGECQNLKNTDCQHKCITFRDNDGSSKNINDYQFLA